LHPNTLGMAALSPREIYIQRLGPGLLEAKKARLTAVWKSYVEPQLQSGKLSFREKFDLQDYLDTIQDILDFPTNKRIQRAEISFYSRLDLMPKIEKKLCRKAKDIFIGAYPSGLVMATVTLCADRQFLVLINEGLINFSQAIATWCIESIHLEFDHSFVKSARQKARDYFSGYKHELELVEDFSVQPLQQNIIKISKITHYCLEYAIAHEIGHIVNGDLKEADFTFGSFSGQSLKVLDKKLEKEFLADRFALDVLSKVNDVPDTQDEAAYAACGILLFFLVGDMLEFLHEYNLEEATHPPIAKRADAIVPLLEKVFPDHLALSLMFQEAFATIFDDLEL